MTSATDNRTTELLPCPFCGGEARHYAPGPIDHHIECVECYADIHRDTEAEAITAWNTRAAHGTLTAEQVRHASHGHYKLRIIRDVDGLDVPQLTFDWQAIADELNAELGSGTCENLEKRHASLWFVCSKCGARVVNGTYSEKWMHQDHTDEECAEYDGEPFNYCPNCGARVVDDAR